MKDNFSMLKSQLKREQAEHKIKTDGLKLEINKLKNDVYKTKDQLGLKEKDLFKALEDGIQATNINDSAQFKLKEALKDLQKAKKENDKIRKISDGKIRKYLELLKDHEIEKPLSE